MTDVLPSCPAPDRVLDYLAGKLASRERDALDVHVDRCDQCRELFVELARTGLDVLALAPVEEPAAIGRYRVEARLGDGGMGTVYAAYDPQLDRRVAVKLVHPELAERGGIERLLREGRALARLAHPNVVAVHDAGTDGDRVYVAMELVEGETLAAWLAAEPRGWRAIAGMFAAAGRGIAAAHRAGIVHRDVKPENVLVDRAGRPKVADFGLAGHSDPIPIELSPRELGESPERLTQPGTVMGTPLFMSPEQRRGEEVGAATDQYSLCAALQHALRGTAIPRRLGRAIARGLATDPAARFPSMDELVAAIDPARRTGRALWIAGAALGAGAALAIAAVVVAVRSERDAFDDACTQAAAERAQLWTARDRTEVATAVRATKVGYADETVPRIDTAIATYLDELAAAETKLCADRPNTAAGRDVSVEAFACLDDRRSELAAMIAQLHHPSEGDVQRAVIRIHRLPLVTDCANASTLAGELAARSTFDRLANRAEVSAEMRAANDAEALGDLRGALAHARRAVELARAFGGVVLAKALIACGDRSYIEGFAAVEAAEREAATVAEAARADELRATAMAKLMAATAREPGREKEALALQPLVEAAIARANKQVALTPIVHQAVGTAQLRLGHFDGAIASFKAALAAARAVLPPGDPRLPDYIDPVGVALSMARRDADALTYHEDAHRAAVEALGANHPDAAIYAINMATKHAALGDCTRALGELAQARTALEHVLRADSPERLQIAEVIGTCHYVQHRYDEALREHAFRQDTLRAAGRARSVEMAATWLDIGDVQLDRKQFAEAVASYRRSVDELEDIVGKTDARLAYPLTKVGEAELAAARPDRAREVLERALALYASAKSPPIVLAEAMFPLARAVRAKDPVRAKELATTALAAFAAGGPTYAQRAAAAEAWLKDPR